MTLQNFVGVPTIEGQIIEIDTICKALGLPTEVFLVDPQDHPSLLPRA